MPNITVLTVPEDHSWVSTDLHWQGLLSTRHPPTTAFNNTLPRMNSDCKDCSHIMIRYIKLHVIKSWNVTVSHDQAFTQITTLLPLLPTPIAQNYSLRNRPHNRQLPDRISRITYCNFTVRMLYRNMYWLVYILDMRFVLFLCTTAVWQLAINEYVMLCYIVTTDFD